MSESSPARLLNLVSVLCVLLSSACGTKEKETEQSLGTGTDSMLIRHCRTIQASAGAFGLPAVTVGGVVAAEQTLNIGVIDRVQDAVIRRLLKATSSEWWDRWLVSNEALEERFAKLRLIGNKWPERLVLTTYVGSVGPAQLTPRTVLRACRSVPTPTTHPCHGGVKHVLSTVLDDDGALELAAVVLAFEALQWKTLYGEDIRGDIGLLASLYSAGGDYYRHRHGAKTVLHEYNAFGNWLLDHRNEIARVTACSG